MKAPEPGTWRRTSPFAVLFFFGKVIKLITQNAWQSLAPLAAFAVAYKGNLVETVTIAGIGAFVLIAAAAVLRYWFFRYQFNADAILIRQGVVKKSQLDIKFDRIQGINTQQNIVFRYFGLVTVTFDTAGSSGEEGSLPAVSREFADALRQKIGRNNIRTDSEDEAVAESTALLQLGWREMVRIGLADRRVYVVLAALGPLYERIGENFYSLVGRHIEDIAMRGGVTDGVLTIIGLVVLVLLVLTALSIGAAFLRYHNFRLYLDDQTLRSTGGLLTRHEVSMDLGKIQTLRLTQGLIFRWFGRFEMSARQARASHQNDKGKNFVIPHVDADQASGLRRRFMGNEGRGLVQIPSSDKFRRISPWVMRTPLLINVLGPLAFSTAVFFLGRSPAVFIVCLWIPIAVTAIILSWRHAGYHYTDEGLVRRSGMIGFRTVALLYRKVQRVTVKQSPLQRRKGLATLRVYMASGSVRVPYIADATAKQLRDYILYKVESSTKAWH